MSSRQLLLGQQAPLRGHGRVHRVLPLVYLAWSLFKGAPAGPNPWNAKGLEWTTDSPPPKENFRAQPVVTDAPYAYDPEHPER